ncbi:MAG: SsrA-binding protein SmpB [Planctomycetota bacterium]
MARTTDRRPIATNRKARHRFLVLEEVECGIALTGTEVKSLRAGRCSIAEAYAVIKRGELWLVGATIPEYSHGNVMNHAPGRERKLLVHARERRAWEKRVREKGFTLVPLEIYFRGPLVKVRLALVRGKRLADKREAERRDTARREIDRALSRRR